MITTIGAAKKGKRYPDRYVRLVKNTSEWVKELEANNITATVHMASGVIIVQCERIRFKIVTPTNTWSAFSLKDGKCIERGTDKPSFVEAYHTLNKDGLLTKVKNIFVKLMR